MNYWFFFSYARLDRDEYLKDFFRLLKENVRTLSGELNEEAVGFFDAEDIEPGAAWPETLATALQSCRAFVSIYSPTYFQKDFCGKEWSVFHQRQEAYAKTGDRDPRLMFVSSSPSSPSSNYPVLLKLGLAHALKGDQDQAAQKYGEVIRHYEPMVKQNQPLSTEDRCFYAKASMARGDIRFDMGDVDGALIDYNKALRYDTDSFELYLNRCNLEAWRDNYGRALADYENAIRIDSHDPRVYLARANVYKDTGDLRRAAADYEKAIVLGESHQTHPQIVANARERLRAFSEREVVLESGKIRISLHYQDSKDV